MRALLILSLAFTHAALADEWLCTEASAVRSGSTLTVCGIGEADSEGVARAEALKQAKKEFVSLCSASADCRNREADLSPLRTTCEKKDQKYKCYRGLKYEISDRVNEASFLENQKRLLDEELRLVQARMALQQEVQDKERALQNLKSHLDAGELADATPRAPRGDSAILFGFDLCGLGSSRFAGEGFTMSFGANVRYKATSFVGVEAGGNLDVIFPNTYRASTGYNVYGAVPFYLMNLVGREKDSVLFVAPEVRYVEHGSKSAGVLTGAVGRQYKTAYGFSLGWHDVATNGNNGWGVRAGLSDLFGGGSHTSFFLSFTYLFGI